jgi:putative membrane protein
MKRMGVLSLACAAAFAMACNGNARTDNRNEPAAVGTAGEADRTAVHDSDKDFVNHMLSDGMAEVELGKMASQRAVNPDVKRFGQMMVDDHSKAGDELKAIAGQYGVQPAPAIDDRHQDLMNKLSKLRGSQFDREYIDAMVDGHEKVVDSLQGRVDSTAPLKDRIANKDQADKQVVPEKSDNAPKASINAWAANALPVVRHHLDEAKRLDDLLDSTRTSTRNEATPVKPRK